ncbi:MmyB family transcriptional regulator [Parafrankia elaeagni]|uniref:MmyB family transcriptional regulator n=1 Tax=Parafrankia elaeagni TaxID=222534 RepID=UPI0003A9EEE6
MTETRSGRWVDNDSLAGSARRDHTPAGRNPKEWAEHRVTSASHDTKHYRHPAVGDLTLDCDIWAGPEGSGQQLIALTNRHGRSTGRDTPPTHSEKRRRPSSWRNGLLS